MVEFVCGVGGACLIAVDQDASGSAKSICLAIASAIGGGLSGIIDDLPISQLKNDRAILLAKVHATNYCTDDFFSNVMRCLLHNCN